MFLFELCLLLQVKLHPVLVQHLVLLSELCGQIYLVCLHLPSHYLLLLLLLLPHPAPLSLRRHARYDPSCSLLSQCLRIESLFELLHGQIASSPGRLAVDVVAVERVGRGGLHEEQGDVGDRAEIDEVLEFQRVEVGVEQLKEVLGTHDAEEEEG